MMGVPLGMWVLEISQSNKQLKSPEQLLANSSPYNLQQGLLAFVNRHQSLSSSAHPLIAPITAASVTSQQNQRIQIDTEKTEMCALKAEKSSSDDASSSSAIVSFGIVWQKHYNIFQLDICGSGQPGQLGHSISRTSSPLLKSMFAGTGAGTAVVGSHSSISTSMSPSPPSASSEFGSAGPSGTISAESNLLAQLLKRDLLTRQESDEFGIAVIGIGITRNHIIFL